MSPHRPVTAPLVFGALADQTRLALLDRLCAKGPSSISGLSHGAPVTRQAITKHLHVLANAGLVRDRRRGREHIWELEKGGVDEARHRLDQLSRRWDEALDRLKRFVEPQE
jgi:DNA-binding transcriptional ArsR family regulator